MRRGGRGRRDGAQRAVGGRDRRAPMSAGGALQIDQATAGGRRAGARGRDLRHRRARDRRGARGCRLTVRAGEILGIAGRRQWPRRAVEAIVGPARRRFGSVAIAGRELPARGLRSLRSRAGPHPGDRHDRALILDDSIAENLILGHSATSCGAGYHRPRPDPPPGGAADRRVRPSARRSGARGSRHVGRQPTEVVVARELSRRARRWLLCAPSRRAGVDIGAIGGDPPPDDRGAPTAGSRCAGVGGADQLKSLRPAAVLYRARSSPLSAPTSSRPSWRLEAGRRADVWCRRRDAVHASEPPGARDDPA